ncbi:MAG: restriction endonuclease subunit S [Burkholderiaceae bacterium]|nr:restriction endonuclease subunit S [Burkholderiaceae bacterium]
MSFEQIPLTEISPWSVQKISALGTFERGKSKCRPRHAPHLYGGVYPFIQTGDITNSTGRITTFRQTYNEVGLAQSKLWPAGTLCITIAANIAETALLTFPACFPDSVVGFIPDQSKADVIFIAYLFQTMRANVKSKAYGTAQENINLEVLRSLEFPVPDLSTQKSIARILSTIDDRIQLLRETNTTLEAIAQALFKSWFVDFDPVHAKQQGREPEGMDANTAALFPDSFEESELGLVPMGWRVGELKDTCNITSGKRPLERSDQQLPNIHIPLFGGAGIMGFTATSLFDEPKILTGRVGTLGKVHIANPPFWASDNVLVLTPKEKHLFLYSFLWMKEVDVIALNRGSTQPLLTQKDLGNQKRVIPADSVLIIFETISAAIYKKIHENEKQAQTLANLRDTLLPRLISGQLRLPESL